MNKIFLIGEIGHNWRDLDEAKDLIRHVKYAGWDAAKFQLYDIDKIKKPGDTNYEELKAKQLTKKQMFMLKEYADAIGVEFMCSVFDKERLEWYLETNPKRIKLAQRSSTDIKLINKCLEFNLPLIISLNPENPHYLNYNDVVPGDDVDYLFCLSRRQILRNGVIEFPKKFDKFRGYAGFSDHTIGTHWPKRALANGAIILEKHITNDHNAPGWDNPASADLAQMKEIAQYARWLEDRREINAG